MTKTLSMVGHKNYNLSANEDFVIFLTSMLITCFIDGFTLKMKSQSIAYLLNESEHIYWIQDPEDEVHSIWDLWISPTCKEQWFFRSWAGGQQFSVGSKKSWLPMPKYSSPEIFVGGNLTSSQCPGRTGIQCNGSRLVLWIVQLNWESGGCESSAFGRG